MLWSKQPWKTLTKYHRIRKVKCDEAEPSCNRCIRSGRRCDGYVPRRVVHVTFDVPGSHEERRSYHFFRMKSVTEMVGVQDAAFWHDFLLQFGHSEPAVKHALVAIASLHESLEASNYDIPTQQNDAARKLRTYSLNYYNKAITSLVANKSERWEHLATTLILCLLFLVFEEFQSGYVHCATHLSNGLAMWEQWKLASSNFEEYRKIPASTTNLINHHIGPIFTRMFAQAATFMDSREHTCQGVPWSVKVTQPTIPEPFTTLTEARTSLDAFMRWMLFCLGNEDKMRGPEAFKKLKCTLEAWMQALDALTESKGEVSQQDLKAIHVMMIYYHVSFIMMHGYLVTGELAYDEHIERFQTIIDLAQDTLSTSEQRPHEQKLDFSFDLGITPPLYFVATHCRDPLIRRAALALIQFSHRRTGAWNADHSAKCAEEIIKIEESHSKNLRSCKDVPESSRVRKVFADVQFDQGWIKMQYVKTPYTRDTALETAFIALKSPKEQKHCPKFVRPVNCTEGVTKTCTLRPFDTSLMASFVSSTYFPQEAI